MPSNDLLVLVPDPTGEQMLDDLDGVRAVRYDESGGPDALPAEAADAQVFVPGFLAAADALTMLERCPKVRLVQLLSAGAERWVDRLPEGVGLSDCQGAHGGVTAEWVLAGLLAVLRDLPRCVRDQDREHWDQRLTDTLRGQRVLLVGSSPSTSRRSPVSGAAPATGSTRPPSSPTCCRTTTSSCCSCPSPTRPAGWSTRRSSPP